ncbi:hypothetical protein JCM10207_004863 [Rhodosporidiobolus poonsookiae]
MQFPNAPESFPEAAAGQANSAASHAHPQAPHAPHAAPHPHPHPYPHPSHYPHPAAPRGGYSFASSWAWPRFGAWHTSYLSPFATAGGVGGVPPPPHPPYTAYAGAGHPEFPSSWADRRAWRRFHRLNSGPRFRVLPFLLLGGAGWYGYKKLKGEVRDVKAAVAAADPNAAATIAAREHERYARWGGHHGWRHEWRDHEARWAAWQAQMQQKRVGDEAAPAAPEQPAQAQEKKRCDKWV